MSVPAIEMKGVRKAFRRREREAGAPWWRRASREKVALHELDLCVEPGGVTGILGPNGSGKSTLIRILGTLLTPDSGTARVFGWDVVDQALEVRRHVNRVSVEAAFFKELSPWENMVYAARLYGSAGRGTRRRVVEILELLGLPFDVIDQPLKQLSRGQQQKVAIARSFLTAPSLLCTHDMDEAAALCERVLMMDGGRVLADGSPAELCRAHGGATLEDVFMHLTGKTLEAEEEPEGVAR
jgi:ABC-2 type transport system ATP-binding protein